MNKVRTWVIAGALLGSLAIVGFEACRLVRERAALSVLQARQEALVREVSDTRRLRNEAVHDAALLKDALSAAHAANRDEARGSPVASWSSRLKHLHQLAKERPELHIPEIKLLADKDWLEVAQKAEFDTEDHTRDTVAALRSMAKDIFAGLLQPALRKYVEATHGDLPASPTDLLPYCDSSIDAAMLARYAMARTGKVGEPGEYLVSEQSPLDPSRDGTLSIALWGSKVEVDGDTPPAGAGPLASAIAAYQKDHQGKDPANEADLSPYIKDNAALSAAVQDLAHARQEYAKVHQGTMPTNPAEALPYMKNPANLNELMFNAGTKLSSHE